jgi:predicted kinase
MVIMVMGLPGSGKSYFGERLAQKLGVEYLNSDQIRSKMDLMGQYADETRKQVYDEMAKKVDKLLGESQSVLVDATFQKETYRKSFLELAEKYKKKVSIIWVWAEENLIIERLRKKRKDSEADFEVYRKLKTAYDNISRPHLKLQSTNDNIDRMLDQAAAYIQERE